VAAGQGAGAGSSRLPLLAVGAVLLGSGSVLLLGRQVRRAG
jgi:hypothetical protein